MLIKNLFISAIVVTLLSTQLFALPPQVEADRLGLAAKTAMETKDYKTAVEKLEAMQKLGVKLPDTFSYHYGVSLLETGRYKESLAMFDQYLSQGQGAKFYKEALEKYNVAEEKDNESKQVFIDNTTGLMWQNSACTNEEEVAYLSLKNNGKVMNWDSAKKYCENLNFAGFSDWRLPDIDTLKTIIDTQNEPKIKKNLKNAGKTYWSSSTSSVKNSNLAMYVDFKFGDDDPGTKDLSHYVRCVRDNK